MLVNTLLQRLEEIKKQYPGAGFADVVMMQYEGNDETATANTIAVKLDDREKISTVVLG